MPIIVVLVLGPIFLIVVGSAISLQMKVIASRRWAATPGHIISSEVATGWKYGGGRRKGHIIYFPKVVYEYHVGGQTYQGDRIIFGSFPPTKRPDEAQRKLTQYPLHSTGQVFYNPQNPSESVLEQSSPRAKTLWFVAGVLLLLILMVQGLALLLGTLLPYRGS